MPILYSFYGDESGNSGPDYFDANQPIYVFAAVGWRASAEAFIRKEYEDLCSRHGRIAPHLLPAGSKAPKEWKAEKLLDRQSGRMFCESLLEMVLRLELPCLFGIAEKRYLLTAMLIETYLDPSKNPLAPPEHQQELRQALATAIYEIADDALLADFSSAAKNDDVASLGAVGQRIANRARLHLDRSVSRWSSALEQGASQVFRFGEKVDGRPKRSERV